MKRFLVTWKIRKGCAHGHSIRYGLIVEAKTHKAAVKSARVFFEQSSDAYMYSIEPMRLVNVAQEEFLIKELQSEVRFENIDDVILYPSI